MSISHRPGAIAGWERFAAPSEFPDSPVSQAMHQPVLLGLFLPIQAGGWSASTLPRSTDWTFEYNRELVLEAERQGFDLVFALSQWLPKGGYGGVFNGQALDAFMATAALTAVTSRIILVSTIHVLYGPIHPLHLAKYAASHTADALNVDRPAVTQPLYNLANRQIESEHLPAAEQYGLAVVPYSPLARGVLTAKYQPGVAPPAGSRAGRDDRRIQQTEWRPESLDIAQQIKQHVEGRGITPGQFALAWVLNNSLVTSAIAGPRTLEQWEDYVPALQYRFTDEDEALVDRLVKTGHASAPGFNDPSHPFFGRRPRHHFSAV